MHDPFSSIRSPWAVITSQCQGGPVGNWSTFFSNNYKLTSSFVAYNCKFEVFIYCLLPDTTRQPLRKLPFLVVSKWRIDGLALPPLHLEDLLELGLPLTYRGTNRPRIFFDESSNVCVWTDANSEIPIGTDLHMGTNLRTWLRNEGMQVIPGFRIVDIGIITRLRVWQRYGVSWQSRIAILCSSICIEKKLIVVP